MTRNYRIEGTRYAYCYECRRYKPDVIHGHYIIGEEPAELYFGICGDHARVVGDKLIMLCEGCLQNKPVAILIDCGQGAVGAFCEDCSGSVDPDGFVLL